MLDIALAELPIDDSVVIERAAFGIVRVLAGAYRITQEIDGDCRTREIAVDERKSGAHRF